MQYARMDFEQSDSTEFHNWTYRQMRTHTHVVSSYETSKWPKIESEWTHRKWQEAPKCMRNCAIITIHTFSDSTMVFCSVVDFRVCLESIATQRSFSAHCLSEQRWPLQALPFSDHFFLTENVNENQRNTNAAYILCSHSRRLAIKTTIYM